MSFNEAKLYLDQLGEPRMRLTLEPMHELLRLFNHPDQSLKSLIVGGTNGKGSTCAFLTSIATAAGLKVGTYTSPHLESVTERIAINGKAIDEEYFASQLLSTKRKLEQTAFKDITYFEFMTLLALQVFVDRKVDLAIFEVGIGGRLDATNALKRIGTLITPIDFDHMNILGNTLEQIACEKGAIMRKGIPCVLSLQRPEVLTELIRIGNTTGAKLFIAYRDFKGMGTPTNFDYMCREFELPHLSIRLLGEHQVENAASAIALLTHLDGGFEFSNEEIATGLERAFLPGRLEKWTLAGGKEIWLDVGHNPQAALKISEFFSGKYVKSMDVVVGMLADKDWEKTLAHILPIARSLTLCRPNSPRAWDINQVQQAIRFSIPTSIEEDPVRAFQKALSTSNNILCTGSFYTVGSIRSHLLKGTEAKNRTLRV